MRVLAGTLAILLLGDQLLFLFVRETLEQFAGRLLPPCADSRLDVAASRLNKDNHQVRAARCPKSGRVHKRLGEIESGTARLKEAVAAWQVCLTSLSPYGRNPECNGCALRFAPGGKPHVGDRSAAAALWRRGDRRLAVQSR